MGREEAGDRKSLCKRIPIKQRMRMIKHRQEEYPAWISIYSVTLKTTHTRWKRLKVNEGTSTLEPPSAFAEMKRNLPESSSPGNSKDNEQRLLVESTRRRRIEGAARVPFLGILPKEEWVVHHRDHENRTG